MAAETNAPAGPEVETLVSDKVDVAPPSATKLADKPAPAPAPEAQEVISGQPSFKEETYIVNELPEIQKKALDELKKLIQDALNSHEFTAPPPKEEEKKLTEEVPASEIPAAEEKIVEEEKKTEEAPAIAFLEEKLVEEKKTEEAPASDTAFVVVVSAEEKLVEEVKKTEEAPAPEKIEEKAEKQEPASEEPATVVPPEDVFLWGIPILGDERSDVILLKFLRARDFKVKETLAMIKKCVRWRKEFGVDSLVEEDLGDDYNKAVFVHGSDKEGRPVIYNVFSEFNNKELYQLAFSDTEKQSKLLKWLVQFMERTVRKMEFNPDGINSFVLVNDLKNSPGYGKREFYKIINRFFVLLQDNYPEFVAKQVCLNVSWWYLAYSWVYVSVFTPRSKSKFVFSSSSKAADTLFSYVAPEQVPVQYGGHSRVGELEFTTDDSVTEVTIKPSSKHTVEFQFKEVGCVFLWELRVVGWECNYEAQFVPDEGYTVLVSKTKKMSSTDEPIICDSFKIGESGKLILTIDNHSSKKKKLLYRSKIKASQESQ
ncbi:uncharacterized protein [Phyllobates terribilis]|uniref:uncharacterized protein n=1 Tax=Phyllobates terribilis TaxID=111132 RepID=UPI003CCB0A52